MTECTGRHGMLADRIIRLLEEVHPLDRVARAGYVLRGVPEPESVAAHSFSVALLALVFVEVYPGKWNREKLLAMALVHDLAEARLMDIPMPASDAHLRNAKDAAEQAIARDMFDGLPGRLVRLHKEFQVARSPEARLLRGLDKAQMMLKVLCYERERQGRLDEFWENPRNFPDFGIEPLRVLFDAICAHAGRVRPRESNP